MPDMQTANRLVGPVEPTIVQLEAEITTLGAHLNAGTYRFLVLIGEFDQREGWGGWGIRSCAHWLNWKCGLGLGAAREQLRVASALRGLPRISEALRAGRLSYTKVRAMTRIATAENEHVLLKIAENGTASHIETVVRHYRRTQRAEELHRDAERHRRRTFRYYWDHDGSLVIEGRLPPEHGALVVQALKAADQTLRDASGARAPVAAAPSESRSPFAVDPCNSDPDQGSHRDRAAPSEIPAFDRASLDPEQQEALEKMHVAAGQRTNPIDADDERETRWSGADASATANRVDAANVASVFAQSNVSAETSPHVLDWGQRQADALTLLAETMLTHGACSRHGADRHLLHVHVDISTLYAPAGEGRSEIEDGPAIPPETLRRLGCDAALVTWIEDAAGKTLDVGRKTRVLSAGLRRALEQRDTRCRFPACEQRGFLDAHHIEHWADGGQTKLENLIAICRRHHRALHEDGFRIEGDADAPRFIRPDGRVIETARCARQSSTPGALAAQNARIGLAIDARTAMTGWGGERADYTHMLTILGQYDAGQVRSPTEHRAPTESRRADSAGARSVSAETSA
jgi:hypothetical protein